MCWRPLVWLLAVSALNLPSQQERVAHRLIGGHLKIFKGEDSQDADFLIASASGSKTKKPHKNEDEEKKTLSQQVADGKYGLIQKELFSKPSKRPGVLSYDVNPEVPTDNIKNLGGLTKNDIWLAENHLLVIRGGTYPPHDDKKDETGQVWPSIDDYKAPSRQVKLPAHPKVPPPFPVQLTDDGPLQILGTNFTRTLNGTFDASAYPISAPEEGAGPGTGEFFPYPPNPYPSNITSGEAPFPIPAYPPGEYDVGSPFPPFPLNGTLPPFFASLPPGAAILPPPGNQTESFDEDDPSIYYPPPYSFYYPKDNSSVVPPGPLVPGIILPPPPNFFGPLEDTTTTTTITTRKPTRVRTKTTTALPQIHPTTPSVPPTSVLDSRIPQVPAKVFPVHVPEINNELKPVVTSTPTPSVVTVLPVRPKNRTYFIQRTQKPKTPPSVTILKPVKPSTVPPKIYIYDDEVSNKPFEVYGPPSRIKTVISTTQVPLKLYYSTASDIETNSITQPPEKFHIGITNGRTPKTTQKTPAQYYYYEEERANEKTTPKPTYYDYVPVKPTQTQKPQFVYVTSPPYNTRRRPQFRFVQQQPAKVDTFSIHIGRLQKQITQYYTTSRPAYRPAKPVYQFSFEAANYRPAQNIYQQSQDPQDKFRPLPRYSVQIQPAVEIIPTESPTPRPVYYQQQNYPSSTERPVASKYYSTPRPDYDYEEVHQRQRNTVTSRPINQYSFEATPSPVYQGFYTKPDEGYFDEHTKEYFTTFGKKIPGGTTPLPHVANQSQRQVVAQVQPQRPGYSNRSRKPSVSLEGDIAVNYLPSRPPINPDAEFVPVQPNRQRANYPQVSYSPRPQYIQNAKHVNDEGPEVIKAVPVEVPTAEGQPGSYISYQLPGDDGAHFYFLTPQLAQRRDQGAGYYFAQSNAPRVRRDSKSDKS